MLDKIAVEEGVGERSNQERGSPKPRPPQTPREEGAKSRPLRDSASPRVAGALVRTYDEHEGDHDDHDDRQSEEQELIASTRAMFDTLLHGHSTIMQSHTAIESEINQSRSNARDLLETAQTLQARVDALEEELAQAAQRECALEQELLAVRTKSLQTGDADELAWRIEKLASLAATIQTVLADTDKASRGHRAAAAAELVALRRQCTELQMHAQVSGERVQKLTRMLDAELDRMKDAGEQLSDAQQQNKALAQQVRELEMELQTKSEELELMFKTSEARRHEQRKAAEQHDEKRAELQVTRRVQLSVKTRANGY